jgi:exodeoxyribonuclease VIII
MKPGFYTADQLSNEDYHASEGVSCSGLKLIDRSPAHYKHKPSSETKPQFMGTATHAACLEPERFADTYVRLPDEYKDMRSAGVKALKEELADRGRILIKRDDFDNISGMRQALADHPMASQLLTGARFETSCYAIDPVTGELCRVRADILSESGWVVDLKKCQDARPFAAAKAIASYDYHLQAPFYKDVLTWASPENPPSGFAFIFVEEQPPHAVGVYVLNSDDEERGRNEYRRLLGVYHDCKQSGDWPAYGTDAQYIELPDWKRFEIDQRSTDDE